MCGICGEFRFDGQPSPANWDRLTETMSRRGPDASGLWTNNQRCTFAFRRLSILDLNTRSNQPMTAHDDRYALVYNGELYNYRDLKEKLIGRGVRFKTTGDTEVVLHSLIEFGHQALSLFNGMFALAFFDADRNRLLLARDHAGIKPLYYMETNKGLFFSSQYDQILMHPWSSDLPVSDEALSIFPHLGFIPAPYAILEHTHMLEPGAYLEVSSNEDFRTGSFFSFPRFSEPALKGPEAIEALDAAISGSVKNQLISDVPVGAFLSGGIDSPLVVSKILDYTQSPIEAFTIATTSADTDESYDARLYAEELGVKHSLKIIDENHAVTMLDDVMSACQEPFGDYSIFPTILLCKLASDRFKVMLSGDGGDELFFGYTERFVPTIRYCDTFTKSALRRKLNYFLKKYLNVGNFTDLMTDSTLGSWHLHNHSHLKKEWLEKIFLNFPGWPDHFNVFNFRGGGSNETAQWLRWNEFVCHLTGVLLKVDRASMFNSLEVRVPLLDLEVVKTAFKIDWETCIDINSEIGKLPLRQLLRKHVQHQTTAKKGFSVPMNEWLRTSLRGHFEEYVLNRKSILNLEIDQKKMRALYQLHLDNKADFSWGLWPLLSLSLWADKYLNDRKFSNH